MLDTKIKEKLSEVLTLLKRSFQGDKGLITEVNVDVGTDLETKLSSIEDKLDTIQDKLDVLDSTTAGLEDDIALVEDSVYSLENALDKRSLSNLNLVKVAEDGSITYHAYTDSYTDSFVIAKFDGADQTYYKNTGIAAHLNNDWTGRAGLTYVETLTL